MRVQRNMKQDGSGNRARLVEGNVGRMLVRLTIPMIFGILSMVAFNLADTYFVSRLGALELAALSFTFPVVLVINSLALGMGIGASAVISRAIGEGNEDRVRRLTTDSLSLSFLIVICFVVIGQLTIDPLFRILGATPELLPRIKEYMRIWYWGMIFVVVPMVGNNAIRAGGDTKTPSLIMMLVAGLNFLIDPFLILGIGPFPRLEITGAAIATVIARAFAMGLSLYVLCRREKMITLHLRSFKRTLDSWKQILYIGLPAAGSRLILPVGVGVVTRFVSAYGPHAVAGYGVASRFEFFAMTVVAALSTVMGPFVGQNLGAGKIDRVRRSVRLGYRFALVWGLFVFVLMLFAARPVAGLFSGEETVINTIILYLRVVPLAYGLAGILYLSIAVLNVFRKPYHAAFLTAMQMFLVYIPLASLGSRYFGLQGIFGALLISYGLSGCLAALLLNRTIRHTEEKKPDG
jgi:putative MATE family efflux protein